VETVFLPAEAHYLHLSSTLIKEVAGLGGSVSDYVPRSVQKRLLGGEPAPGQSSRG
jgi:pantetheine-phosphate adenylyltransferase